MVIRDHRLPDLHACSPIHGFVTFASVRGDGLRERMLEQEVQRLKQRQGH